MKRDAFQVFFDASAGGGGGGATGAATGTGTATSEGGGAPTWDSFYGGLGDTEKNLIGGHVDGLKKALNEERTKRTEFERQVKELSKNAEEGSELKAELDKIQAELAGARQRAALLEQVTKAGLKAEPGDVIALAQARGLVDGQGNINFAQLKEQCPYLFQEAGAPAPKTKGEAGTGHRQKGAEEGGLNDLVLNALGRR
ncbi:MAG: hypothetical protein ABFD60_04225 [Bryobacteraceae bacterium]